MSFPATTPGLAAGVGQSPAFTMMYEELLFVESAQTGNYTGSIVIPEGATVYDVIWSNQVLWADADMTIGDDADADCFTNATSVAIDSTPSADGDEPTGNSSQHAVGEGTTKRYPNGGHVNVVIVPATTTGTAGRTTVGVILLVPSGPVTVPAALLFPNSYTH